MATAQGQKVTSERIALYCHALSDIGESPLTYAFEQALKHLGDFLPSIEQLRAYSEQWRPVDPIAETRKYLSREDKPPTWEALGKKAGITRDEIAEWLEAGKEAQREHIRQLEADPAWRAMAQRLGGKDIHSPFERVQAAHNGKSRVPADPEERRQWATRKAKEQGWL